MHGDASIGEEAVFAWSNNNYNHHHPPEQIPISIKRLDDGTGQQEWVINSAQPAAIVPGYLAKDVYFVGSLDGTLRAYNGENGEQLLNLKNPAPIISSLWVRGNTLYLGAGVPGILGTWTEQGENGMYAYSVSD